MPQAILCAPRGQHRCKAARLTAYLQKRPTGRIPLHQVAFPRQRSASNYVSSGKPANGIIPAMANPDKQSKADVIIPPNHPNPPEEHEVDAAWILARHFNTVVEFLMPIEGYMAKTNDAVMLGLIWELKSPMGRARTTVGNQFKTASKQRARNIVFDARRTSITDAEVIAKIRREKGLRKPVRRVLMIGKDGIVIEIG